MPLFRKKPVVIEAQQFTGFIKPAYTLPYELTIFLETAVVSDKKGELIIQTLEGDMTASPGDFIIKGVNGEFYPCKPDIFEKSYSDASAAEEYIQVVIKSDDDGHDFIIPAEEEARFDELLELGEQDGYEAFSDAFEGYATGGAITTALFAKAGYEKEL